MGLRFSRRIKLGDEMTLNLGKRSASLSIGGKHEHVTIDSRGTHASASLPGTEVSYRTGGSHPHGRAKQKGGSGIIGFLFVLFLIGLVAHWIGLG